MISRRNFFVRWLADVAGVILFPTRPLMPKYLGMQPEVWALPEDREFCEWAARIVSDEWARCIRKSRLKTFRIGDASDCDFPEITVYRRAVYTPMRVFTPFFELMVPIDMDDPTVERRFRVGVSEIVHEIERRTSAPIGLTFSPAAYCMGHTGPFKGFFLHAEVWFEAEPSVAVKLLEMKGLPV